MSLMSYTFNSDTLNEEITLTITMPEYNGQEKLPFMAVILVPDAKMESNFFLRKEPLERYCCGPIPLATVSLPGHVTTCPPPVLEAFFTDELPSCLGQFPLKICAFFAHSSSFLRVKEIGETVKRYYQQLNMNTEDESLKDFLDVLQAQLQSSIL